MNGVKKEDFRFTVTVKNVPWDVYSFVKDDKTGTLAFSKQGDQYVIGIMQAGTLTEAQVTDILNQSES